MKISNYISLFTLIFVLLVSCSDDDDAPEQINEQEVITTMTITLVPEGGGTTVALQTRDIDADGPNPPEVSVSGNLAANTSYVGSIVLLNETETPVENVNEEIEGEANEHQYFFIVGGGLNATVDYADDESDYVSAETGENFTTTNPVGILFELTTTDASTGTLAVTLRHEPKKPNDGTLADAAGETDITETFTVVIE
ncbi:type 1 periplasmic binding fold superfamily protein [Ulvibacterium sp.]|uniref:type 1 periplasmic binding fold superfamily protein n=1 Tax=Ulvibacterium sp. TaxID=2665914 RepID=UPI003CC6D230